MLRYFLSSIAAFILCSPVFAQNTWEKTGGPIGGLGYNVRIHPDDKNIMFVTDVFSGVNKSTDGGQTWVSSNNGIDLRTGQTGDAIPVFALTIDPFDPNEIWVGTQGGLGVFKSTDTGGSYSSMTNGIEDDDGLTIRNFTVVKINGVKTVFMSCELNVGVQGEEFSKVKGQLFKTEDGGANWVKVWEGNSLARWLQPIPSNTDPERLILATGIFDREAFNTTGEGILISDNNGETWTNSNEGIVSLFVGGIHVDPSNSDNILIGTGNNAEELSGQRGAVHKSTDGGGSWTVKFGVPNGDNTNGKFTAIQFSQSDPNVVYAANEFVVYRSEDKGENWSRQTPEGISWGPPGVIAGVPIEMTVDADNSDILFINNYGGGVFKSTDAGVSWLSLSNGYTGAQMHSVAVSGQDHSLVASIGRSGPFISTNRGAEWEGVQFGAADFPEWYDIVFDPTDQNHLLVSDEHQATIIETTDGGSNWQSVFRHPLSPNPIGPEDRHGARQITFAPSNTNVVYAGFANEGINSGPSVAESNSTVPAGGSGYDGFVGNFQDSYGMVRSTQGGASGSWEAINNGLGGKLNVTQVRVHPEDENTLFITLRSGGIFKSTDAGDNWAEITNDLPERNLYGMDISRQNPDIIYVGTRFYGIWKTTNGGINWTQVLAPVKTVAVDEINSLFGALVVNPADANIVLAADWWSGIYFSLDGGNSWDLWNTGLESRVIRDLEFSADGKFVYAASTGRGVFSMQFTTEALATLSEEELDFDETNVTETSTLTFDLSNYGNEALTINQFQTDNTDYTINTAASALNPGSSMTVSVDFAPGDEGESDGTLTIDTNIGAIEIALNGSGQYLNCESELTISGENTVCGDVTASLDAGSGFDRYQWFLDGEAINGANEQTFDASQGGTYTVRVVDLGVCARSSQNFVFTVNELPGTQITVDGHVLTAPLGNTYQWFLDGEELAGQTNRSIEAAEGGEYTVRVTSAEGCTVLSDSVTATPISDNTVTGQQLAFVYPNPSSGTFTLQFPNPNSREHHLRLVDSGGKVFWEQEKVNSNEVRVSAPGLPKGLYIMRIEGRSGENYAVKIMIRDF